MHQRGFTLHDVVWQLRGRDAPQGGQHWKKKQHTHCLCQRAVRVDDEEVQRPAHRMLVSSSIHSALYTWHSPHPCLAMCSPPSECRSVARSILLALHRSPPAKLLVGVPENALLDHRGQGRHKHRHQKQAQVQRLNLQPHLLGQSHHILGSRLAFAFAWHGLLTGAGRCSSWQGLASCHHQTRLETV